jgi:cell division protein FtsL
MRGELNEVKRTSSDTSRQTIWQFVIFTVTMAVVAFGGIKYQTDTLRHEMNIRSEAQRQEMNARFDTMEKRFEDLKQEVRANRKQ